jgi:hypothetical protein
MLTVVRGLVIVRVEQALQDLDGLVARGRRRQVPAGRDEVFVSGGYVASTGVTHVALPS